MAENLRSRLEEYAEVNSEPVWFVVYSFFAFSFCIAVIVLWFLVIAGVLS